MSVWTSMTRVVSRLDAWSPMQFAGISRPPEADWLGWNLRRCQVCNAIVFLKRVSSRRDWFGKSDAGRLALEALHRFLGSTWRSRGVHRTDALVYILNRLRAMEPFIRGRRVHFVCIVLLLHIVQPSWGSNKPLPVEKEQVGKWNLSIPNYDLYHRSDVLQKELKALVDRHPLIMSMEVLREEGLMTEGEKGYNTEMTVVTVEAGGTGSKQDQNIRLLLDFGQHGRELVTSEVAFRLLQTLSGEHPLGDVDTNILYRVLPHATIKIIPMENLNGRRKVEGGDLCERKNGRGVDPNRNWGVDWGKKEKDYDPSEEYPGVAAFSEPESKILRGIAESFRPHIWVNVHSGMEALFMPYDHKNSVPVDGAVQMKTLLQTLNKLFCDNNCVVGSGGGSVGYLAHGTATDYMYDVLRVPMAFTWEIYGDMTQPETDCFQMFNPATPNKFENVVSKWSTSFLSLLVKLPRALHSLSNRSPVLEVWDWESWPVSAIPDIPDLQLRSRFPVSPDPLLYTENMDKLEWGSKGGSEAGIADDQEMQLVMEFLLLLAGIVLSWVSLKICRCYFFTGNQHLYGPVVDRGRRVPV